MALPRIYYTDAVYHVISRGNNKLAILKTKNDKTFFLQSLFRYKQRFNFKLFAFVLMDNHFHLVLQTNPIHNISKIMHSLLLSFSCKYRNNYHYVGHVWQGRFISKIITGDQYILECIEYIHNNPVRAKMTKNSVDYIWSSAKFYDNMPNVIIEKLILIDSYGHFWQNSLHQL